MKKLITLIAIFASFRTLLAQTKIDPSQINLSNFDGIRFADQFPRANCGAKITAALADRGSVPGEVIVNQACGTTGLDAFTVTAGNTVRFVEGGTYQFSSCPIILNQGASIQGPSSTGEGDGSHQSPLVLQAANGTNCAALVKMNGSQASLVSLTLDGNKANNPTGGVGVLSTYVTPGTFAGRQLLKDVTIQNFKTDGMDVLSTTAGNEMAGTELDHGMILTNDMDGLFVSKTGDVVAKNMTAFENNGLGGGTFGSGYTTVNVTGSGTNAVVTWVSNSKWSTDASMVGKDVTINNIVLYPRITIASVQSTTQLTLACGNANQPACPGALSGVTIRMGHGVELFASGGNRFQNGDFGGNELDGIKMWGLSTESTFGTLITDNQFGNNFELDVEVQGWDPVGANFGSLGNHIVGNFMIGGAQRTVTSTWPSIYIQDSGVNGVMANTLYSFQTNTYTHAVQIHETVASREAQDEVAANNSNGGFSSTTWASNTATLTAFCANRDPTAGNVQCNNLLVNRLGINTAGSPATTLDVNGAIRSTLTPVSFSATPTFDASMGNYFKLTLTDNVTSSTISNGPAGEQITLLLCQDGGGSHTLVWPGNMKLTGGAYAITSTASKCSVLTAVSDGSNWYEISRAANE